MFQKVPIKLVNAAFRDDFNDQPQTHVVLDNVMPAAGHVYPVLTIHYEKNLPEKPPNCMTQFEWAFK